MAVCAAGVEAAKPRLADEAVAQQANASGQVSARAAELNELVGEFRAGTARAAAWR